jgi:oligopeptide transport system ATP-binding protein
MNGKLVEIENLKKYYPVNAGWLSRQVAQLKAVDGVSFQIQEGETLGLVGESGCGKSTLGRVLLRLEEPSGGKILYRGDDITRWKKLELKAFRREAQMIFQDPQSSLDPRMTIGDSIGEALQVQGILEEKGRLEKIGELLRRVGLEPDYATRYPHEMSGGQKQRVGIARALAVSPKLIVADEPVSALDVSVQAQILNLIMDLQRDFGLAYLFIAHDLAVIGQVSDRVAVMYLGQIVEQAQRTELFGHPSHPYTEALMSCSAIPDPHLKRQRVPLQGEVPSPVAPPAGCHFHPRCPKVMEVCRLQPPVEHNLSATHRVFCHLYH